jgi:hypothetical protein
MAKMIVNRIAYPKALCGSAGALHSGVDSPHSLTLTKLGLNATKRIQIKEVTAQKATIDPPATSDFFIPVGAGVSVLSCDVFIFYIAIKNKKKFFYIKISKIIYFILKYILFIFYAVIAVFLFLSFLIGAFGSINDDGGLTAGFTLDKLRVTISF